MKAILPTGPLLLEGLIDYQPDSVVSQEVLRTPNGTVTLFAFDQDHLRLKWHSVRTGLRWFELNKQILRQAVSACVTQPI